ncbi:MAG: heme-binding protein [Planctomycetota bacterium]|nr:MAG: heme-binding protein [Planctomycetota bacterium]
MSARVLLLSLLAALGVCTFIASYASRRSADNARADGPQGRPGFRVELVYAPPRASEGSWVSLTVDDRGRLIASDQYGLLYRVTPSPVGGSPTQSRCEPIRVAVGAAQGLAYVKGALYAMVNAQGESLKSGLYRVTDSNGDDRYDSVSRLVTLRGSGEHGPHGVVPAPDGTALFFCAGNYTGSPLFQKSRVPAGWGEDQLLPRLDDPAGQASGVPAPGGWIVKSDLEGQQCELFSVGFRNPYDLAFNEHGELFTCDSDLEVDAGTPWYRPPSVLHVISGSDFGWRGGDGIWPTYYPDTLPPVATMIPGSPTGLVAGTATRFPPRYRKAQFVGDWSRGTIYAVHLKPAGATYRGDCEPLAFGVGGVTDLAACPQDGALYFTVGGRQTQSGLYRIVWTGGPAPAENAAADDQSDAVEESAAHARSERQAVEALHAELPRDAHAHVWPRLSTADRAIRYAALTALERTDAAIWQERAYGEGNVLARFTALVALTRRNQPAHGDQWVDAVLDVSFPALSAEEQQTVVRAISLGVMRFRNLDAAMRERLAEHIAAWYPVQRRQVDRELSRLLVRLQSPAIVQPLVEQLSDAESPELTIDAAVTLSAATAGWTVQSRTAVLDWFDVAAKRFGRRSFYPYIAAARARFVAGFSAEERTHYASRLAPPPISENEAPAGPARRFVKNWTADEVVRIVESSAEELEGGPGDQSAGQRLYVSLGCGDCHAIAGEGSSVGPDLTTVGGRYSVADLARAITEPSHEVPDLYRQTVYMVGGRAVIGRPTNATSTTISVTTDMRDPASAVKLRRDEIESETPSPLSPMPSKLLDTLTAREVAALFHFLCQGAMEHSRGTAASEAPRNNDLRPTSAGATNH